jgi:hypothetical protein
MSLISIGGPGSASYSVGVALNYSHLTTTGTVVLATVAGLFHVFTINQAGTSGATATIFDSTSASGATICAIDISSKGTFGYNAYFTNGLTVVVAGSAVGDLTISYVP